MSTRRGGNAVGGCGGTTGLSSHATNAATMTSKGTAPTGRLCRLSYKENLLGVSYITCPQLYEIHTRRQCPTLVVDCVPRDVLLVTNHPCRFDGAGHLPTQCIVYGQADFPARRSYHPEGRGRVEGIGEIGK